MAPVCDATNGLADALVKTSLEDKQSEFTLKLVLSPSDRLNNT